MDDCDVKRVGEPDAEIRARFLQISATYLFSEAYRESLRAAFARHAAAADLRVRGANCHENVTPAA